MNKALQTIITNGQTQVNKTMEGIFQEFKLRQDILAKSDKIAFSFGDENKLKLYVAGRKLSLTDWSLGQMLNKASLPANYYASMLKANQNQLALTNLRVMIHTLQDSILIREVGDTAKGILSAQYKRMDASPMFETFIEAMLKNGYFPYKAFNTDSQYQVRFLSPDIIRIGSDEILIGFSISTSDYGARSFAIEVFVIRLICQNGLIGMDIMRRKHIGRRAELDDEDYSIYSNRTLLLENKSFQSKIKDIIRNDNTVKLISDKIKDSQNREIRDTKTFLESIKELTKDQKVKVEVLFDTDTVMRYIVCC